MQAHTLNLHHWLTEENSSAINLGRWQQQVNLAYELFDAKAAFIIQMKGTDCKILCEKEAQELYCYHDDVFSYSNFLHRLDIDCPAEINFQDDNEAVIS